MSRKIAWTIFLAKPLIIWAIFKVIANANEKELAKRKE
jgi:hypothetical protein